MPEPNFSYTDSFYESSNRKPNADMVLLVWAGASHVMFDEIANDYRDSMSAGTEVMSSTVELHKEQEQFVYELHAAFEIEHFEDGMDHPADEIIDNAIQSRNNQHILDSLRKLCLDISNPSMASSILRCLSHQKNIGTLRWRVELVEDALCFDDIEIRDAAVQAAESWGGWEMASTLILHDESSPWLRETIDSVIDDLLE